jgi:general stress protein YciG
MTATITNPCRKQKRGFAAMSPERQREISALGDRSVAPENRQFSINRELAREAGRIGGSRSSLAHGEG